VNGLWPWLGLFGLGIFHGINPAMGWLFAVALGLQEQKRAAVFRALAPMALGHALSIGIITGAVLLARMSLPHRTLKIAAAAILCGFGLYRLFRAGHGRWVGMRVGFGDLTLWSFIMASAHGAGLMLVPFFVASPERPIARHIGSHHDGAAPLVSGGLATPALWTTSVAVHSLGYFLATLLVAILVYEKLGVSLLRRAWFNVDFVWALALLITGAFILFF
jgi:hypothetical protein